MTYNIQQFAPAQPGNFSGANMFINARDNRIAQDEQTAIDREKSIALYEAQAVERAKAQAEAADRAILAEAFDAAHKDPTAENRLRLINLYAERNPDKAKAFRENFASYDADKQQGILRDSVNTLTALDTDPEMGIAMLEREADAAKNSNNPESEAKYRDLITKIKSGPNGLQAAKDALVLTIGALPGGDKAIEGVSKIGEEKRKAAAEPTIQAKRLLDAEYTKEQTNKIMAETRKLDQETQGLIIDLATKKKSGGLSEKELKDTTLQLNNTVYSRTAGTRQASTYYENIKNGAEMGGGEGDRAIVNMFSRMLSPGIVTQSDYDSATKSGGVMGEFNVLKDKVLTGDLLLPEQRIKYVTLAKQFLENAQKQSESELISIKKIVKELGIDPELVFNIQPETTQTTEQTSGASPTAKVVGAPAGVGKAVTGGAVDIPALKAFLIGKYPKEEGKINSLTTLEELSRPENYKNSVVEFTTPKTVKVDY